MQLFYRNTFGVSNILNVSSETDLVSSISKVEDYNVDLSSIKCNGLPIKSLDELQEYATIEINEELIGGGKKRKKKNYSTPKKIKHKRKKVKLAILKYYKVDSNGKITRLRRECPNSNCGAGLFMANHFNRQYCGKCHSCYMSTGK
ncbi:hypothetical protein Ciccas_010813 [Cichlidogyrus casuarinus]|uniref:Small ribosomal subunit protein eS31 domain-containing protein n=1 Tax=Cichlidogyrus casuarinus TaxID=1844966 RepID=A0ABD2PT20_9PLAT